MINMARFTQAQADNTCVLNGVEFTCTDEVAQKVLDLLTGANTIDKVAQAQAQSTRRVDPPAPKSSTRTYKDVEVVWNTEKCSTPSGKPRYSIRAYSSNGKALYYKSLEAKVAKALTKSLGTPELVTFSDGGKEYRMRVFQTLKAAKQACDGLPKTITADTIRKYVENGYSL